MAKNVPSSFNDLKVRVRQRLHNGSNDVHADIIEMGDAMLQAGVEPRTAEDRIAKHVWQGANPRQKRVLADLVSDMAKEEEGLE